MYELFPPDMEGLNYRKIAFWNLYSSYINLYLFSFVIWIKIDKKDLLRLFRSAEFSTPPPTYKDLLGYSWAKSRNTKLSTFEAHKFKSILQFIQHCIKIYGPNRQKQQFMLPQIA